MSDKKGVLKSCSLSLGLKDAVDIDTSYGFNDIIKKLLSIDCLVISRRCNDSDTSLVAFLARLLDKKVCWIGEDEPRGLLSHLITEKLK